MYLAQREEPYPLKVDGEPFTISVDVYGDPIEPAPIPEPKIPVWAGFLLLLGILAVALVQEEEQ